MKKLFMVLAIGMASVSGMSVAGSPTSIDQDAFRYCITSGAGTDTFRYCMDQYEELKG
ncbi:hypothetical protein VST7929_02061 [Vibrio stylophorae]|uniref:Uncharacterized protein n=1 Tax=Vibrio stylophorae TaxID=659351 RepID=A0ABM8ZVB2_9VIBR|nr:hypothetical protein [Vibrio stylophorae]CAH0534153.1 hypothetical protein VST7929_02061 [Vibrio stylophorae]